MGAPRQWGARSPKGGVPFQLTGVPDERSSLGNLMGNRPLRIVIAKAGLDGHDRGAKVIARALRDAGMEVIYTGLFQTPEQIVQTAIQEDADGIGLSILSGAHMTLFPLVVEQLKAQGAGDIVFFGGGTIPPEDSESLKALGVRAIFTPGAPLQEIVDFVERECGQRRELVG
jgi:methylmalonyl-CoA mutase, C-terminal domain